jgi:hypothetical protein
MKVVGDAAAQSAVPKARNHALPARTAAFTGCWLRRGDEVVERERTSERARHLVADASVVRDGLTTEQPRWHDHRARSPCEFEHDDRISSQRLRRLEQDAAGREIDDVDTRAVLHPRDLQITQLAGTQPRMSPALRRLDRYRSRNGIQDDSWSCHSTPWLTAP